MAKDAQEKPNFKWHSYLLHVFLSKLHSQRNLAREDDNSVIHYLDEKQLPWQLPKPCFIRKIPTVL